MQKNTKNLKEKDEVKIFKPLLVFTATFKFFS